MPLPSGRFFLQASASRRRFYAGTAAGIYVSKDGGATWAASSGVTSAVSALAVVNGSPNTVFAATPGGLYVTTTGGL